MLAKQCCQGYALLSSSRTILFFLHPELPLNCQQLKDALHAGWMTTFRHTQWTSRSCVGHRASATARTLRRSNNCVCNHQLLRHHLGCRRQQSVAQNPRKCSSSEVGAAQRRPRSCCRPHAGCPAGLVALGRGSGYSAGAGEMPHRCGGGCSGWRQQH